MPNWCRGVLKVRGKKKDLLKFLKDGIEVTYYAEDEKGHLILKDKPLKINNDDLDTMALKSENADHIHIKNTRSCFVVDNIEWSWNDKTKEDLEETYTELIDVEQALRLEVEQFASISRKYNVDFRIKGYECGGEFSQEFIIIKGNITKYEELTYEDYTWEVDDPRLGG